MDFKKMTYEQKEAEVLKTKVHNMKLFLLGAADLLTQHGCKVKLSDELEKFKAKTKR